MMTNEAFFSHQRFHFEPFSGQRQISADLSAHEDKSCVAPGQDGAALVLDDHPVQAFRHFEPRRTQEYGPCDVPAQEHLGLETTSRYRN